MDVGRRSSARGRPSATTHAEIERAAFRLFAQHGFAGTTLDDIAAEVGIARRTLTRYFPSKNDIPWGRFAETLAAFAALLDDTPKSMPLHEAVHRGVLAFNTYDPEILGAHRERLRLILTTPELQAHSVLQYAAWRAVIAKFVAHRSGKPEHDLLPQTVGHVSLALALAAYERWLQHANADLAGLIDRAMGELRDYLSG